MQKWDFNVKAASQKQRWMFILLKEKLEKLWKDGKEEILLKI